MKRALCLGSRGFVGRHITAALVERGYHVHGIDLAPIPAGAVQDDAVYERQMDVREWFAGPAHDTYDLVVHCAAIVGGRRKIEREPLALAVDLAIDADLFTWALRARPGAIVYYSSSAAYPNWMQTLTRHQQMREGFIDHGRDALGTPDLTYGWAKLTGEMLATHARNEGLRVLCPRPFSGYGEDQALDYPWPSFIDRARRRADPFDIWGDGTQVRDWVHIDDVVGATFAALDAGIDGPFNICTGIPTSFRKLASMVIGIEGAYRGSGFPLYRPHVNLCPDEPSGVSYRVGDPTYMRTFYEPQVKLEDAIERALR